MDTTKASPFAGTRNFIAQPLSHHVLPHPPPPDSLLHNAHPSLVAGFLTGFFLNGIGRGVSKGVRGGFFLSGFAGVTQVVWNWSTRRNPSKREEEEGYSWLGFKRLSEREEREFRDEMSRQQDTRKSWIHVRPRTPPPPSSTPTPSPE
ncbi:hypothetical protein BT69DRAFT_1299292 [Atractiella rhizophila]|nr:hypothetical protein BT69DRAFT_1299292 [Atractiella rhizophila]